MSLTVSFNSNDLGKYFIISDMSRPLPEFRDSTTTIEGADGEVFNGLTVGARECSFTLTAKAKNSKSIQDLARMLMQMLTVSTPSRLLFSDELDKEGYPLVRYAIPTGSFNAEEFIKAGRWTCHFKQPDPFLYGKYRQVTIQANKSVKVATGGNAIAYPVATAKPSGSSYTFAGGGKYITYAAAFSGNSVTVNCENQTVSVSPTPSNMSGLQVGSRFFGMKGTITLSASHTTTVSWFERWL